ncbi:thiol protease/hemagglutinin PrtT [Odoribacter sp. OttesenSCG-928-L07]|nr:thiol protease/hemagglutinin PrtT [Odoribacter sp. OttesenSCG-928-L07]MDL2238995.1 thiol protease/hemagglutinin PrtT [Bacteroidales bacterium OttesenSCG-928-L14]MDL2240717.1 thiol protease/hemagglutinin PrtT [Bacteroidales bacterium OttesenSCG-928-K22]
MKRFLLSLALIFFGISLIAEEISVKTAQSVGAVFLSQNVLAKSEINSDDLNLVYTSESKSIPGFQLSKSTTYFYVFDIEQDTGFVIVAADDRSYPILGYSTESYFNPDNIPLNVAKWFEDYCTQLRQTITDNNEVAYEITAEWKNLKNNEYSIKSANSVSPLLQMKWNQLPYYNALCPGGSVTGCVATALAQVLKYWNYPAQGSGFHSYNHQTYGTLSANFGSTTYDWTSMPNYVNSPNNAVATLMYHCGVAVEMNYSPEVSGAYVVSAASPIEHCTEYALKTYFNYKPSLQGVMRDNYSLSTWINMMKTELDAGRPILYAGIGSGGGHAFVCDGYNNNNYFHFNWGWGGDYDGYFMVDALNPTGTGTGGGTGGFNSYQQMIIGVEPQDGGGGGGGGGNQSYSLQLYNYVNTSSSQIYYGQQFSVSTNIANMGSTTFTGDYGAAIFDESLTFIEFSAILQNYTLDPGYVYNNDLVFTSQGLLSMLPGRYYVAICYRPSGGEWQIIADGEYYYNIAQIDVINPSDIEVYSDMILSPQILTQGSPFSVTINVANAGYNNFVGSYGVGLFNMFDGNLVQEIEILNETQGLPPGYCYLEPGITFSVSSITAPPGTYLLAIQHKPNYGSWTLSGSSYYQNPIKVIVKAPEIQGDKYEPNDVVAQSYSLPVIFSGDKAVVRTDGSNLHHGQDYDYYHVELPVGQDYNFIARVYDNAASGSNYTTDVIFCYSLNGNGASEAYDSAMPQKVTFTNGGKLYFAVAPYYAGETGSYLLEIEIEKGAAGINDLIQNNEKLKIFPNPTSGQLTVVIPENQQSKFNYIQITDLQGRKVFQTNDTSFNIEHLPSGMYIIKVNNLSTKIVKE